MGTVRAVRLHGSLALAVAVSTGVIGAGSARAAGTDSCPALDAAVEPAAAVSVAYTAGSTLVGARVAQSQALIDSGGSVQSAYVVEYGPSPDYGLCTDPVALASVPGAQPVTVALTGLTPATTYHFRVIASGDAGTAIGLDQVFTTLPAGELPQGTSIDGIAVGGMKRASALSAVRRLLSPPARLALGDRQWSVSRAKLGARIDARPAIAAALAGMPGRAFAVRVSVDRQRLTHYLGTAERRYAQAPQAAAVRLVGDRAAVTPAKPGIRLAPMHARAAVVTYLTGGSRATLRLPTRVAPAPRSGEKAVVIRLQAQSLTAYQNGKLVLRTPVTTGRLALPTPVGSFSIQSRHSPYTFISPWPQGNPYYYPPTPVTWAMYFYDNDFLHDDPAEPASAFGKGSQNGPYASHGCVHVPHDAMAFLFRWLPIGAKVIVSQT
jgi:lipoprotein-anchoring transpeptidase ErfK/SrfK